MSYGRSQRRTRELDNVWLDINRRRIFSHNPRRLHRLFCCRLAVGETACSPQSGHSSSTCSSPPATASTATNHADVSSTTSTSTCVPANFTSSWSLLNETATGIKSEIRSPGLADSEVAALSQDPLSFYGTAAELGNLYDKDYPQTYSAQQYYNRWFGFRCQSLELICAFSACNKPTAQRTRRRPPTLIRRRRSTTPRPTPIPRWAPPEG